MNRGLRSTACAMALAVGLSSVCPRTACAASDNSSSDSFNTGATIAILLVVVGLVVYVGWQADKEDKDLKVQADPMVPLLADDDRQVGFYFNDLASREDGAVDLSGGLAFRADF